MEIRGVLEQDCGMRILLCGPLARFGQQEWFLVILYLFLLCYNCWICKPIETPLSQYPAMLALLSRVLKPQLIVETLLNLKYITN